MRIFDPHIHMTSRTTDDYEAMYAAGVRALVEPVLLARPAPHLARQLLRLLRRPPRLGTLPRRPVRHRPPLHARPQPQGGQRPALPPGPGRTAPLPRQGRRRRRRRDRLRLDDPRRGHRARRAAPARRRPRAARPRAHPAPRQGSPGLAARSTSSASPPSPADRVLLDHLNETTVKAGHRQRLLARVLHLPGHQDGPGPHGARPARVRHRAGSWSTPPPTGAAATR